jgi:DNA mismatch repair protein MutS2
MTGAFAVAALAAIEFPAALDQVAQYALTPLGASRIRALTPGTDIVRIDRELDRVSQYAARLEAGDDLEPVMFPDITSALERLGLDGAVLDGAELAAVTQALEAARLVGAKLRRAREAPAVASLAAAPLPAELERDLVKAVELDGRIRDAASKALARIRRELVEARDDLVKGLERALASLDARQRPAGATVTLREGRYVIPVKREARAKLGGIVHDESATHATLFVEPAEAIERGNRLRELHGEEAREVQRILRALTAMLRPHAAGLAAAFEMLAAVDACYARARFAGAVRGVRPRIGAGEPLAVRGAAHPLLFTAGATVVRFDLGLDPAERTVLLSGPNTGGKTVLLKAVGLVAALAQSGVIPPVGPETRLPVFGALFTDIGDRQSIRESLSTFSAHVAALRDVLEHADAGSLVLLDELGTGTDPAEGAALAAATLRVLTARGAVTLATTHLGALKQLAADGRGIVNASLQFDAATLAPTYRFTKGIPGRSYGLAIARRLGVPNDILEDAERSLPEDAQRLEQTLATVEARAQELERRALDVDARSGEVEALRGELAAAAARLAEEQRALRREEKELERARKGARREALLEARAEVERAIALAQADQAREARRALEDSIRSLSESGEGLGRRPEGVHRATAGAGSAGRPPEREVLPTVAAGSRVRIESLGLEGDVESVQGNDVAVLVRGRRVRVVASDVTALP